MKKKNVLLFFCLATAGCIEQQKTSIANNQDQKSDQVFMPSKKISDADVDDVQIQFLSEMLTYKNVSTMGTEIAIQMAAQEGASLANAQLTMQGQLLAEKINKNSQTIQTSMQSFQNKSQDNQQKKLQSFITAFSDAQKDVQNQTTQATAISNLELDYIYKNISIDQPQQNYIFNQIQFDQLFTLGTMLTPAGQLWKNPFSVGDWEFDKETNSFWQYQSSPIFNPTTDDNGNPTRSSLQAENNSIFTEYYTHAAEYTIAGSMTMYRIDYPAFIGIIFNKSRWISGDFQAIRKSRLFGIYATSPTDFHVYVTQQYTMTDAQIKADPHADAIQTPLQQILNNKVEKKFDIPANVFADIKHEPITLNFTLINKPTSCTITVADQNDYTKTFTVDNLDPAFYMYHGIGFISPGAVAQFTLTEPKDLVFDDQAVLNFKD